jgi:TatD DNase family protein
MALNHRSSFCYTPLMSLREQLVGYIDSHFHLGIIESKEISASEISARMRNAGVTAGIDIGVVLDDLDERLERLRHFPGFAYSVGLYPSHADSPRISDDIADLDSALKRLIADTRLVALGEVGMDFHRSYGTPTIQRELLEAQLELARNYDLPVIIHNREADDQLHELLLQYRPRGIMHCFSSDAANMERFVELGMYISFAGNMTFKNATELKQAASRVPLDRVLFETDSPFLAPVPHRGKTNTPALVPHVYEYFADLRHMDLGELVGQVAENFSRAVPRYAGVPK